LIGPKGDSVRAKPSDLIWEEEKLATISQSKKHNGRRKKFSRGICRKIMKVG